MNLLNPKKISSNLAMNRFSEKEKARVLLYFLILLVFPIQSYLTAKVIGVKPNDAWMNGWAIQLLSKSCVMAIGIAICFRSHRRNGSGTNFFEDFIFLFVPFRLYTQLIAIGAHLGIAEFLFRFPVYIPPQTMSTLAWGQGLAFEFLCFYLISRYLPIAQPKTP
jgi:hypothetical protein